MAVLLPPPYLTVHENSKAKNLGRGRGTHHSFFSSPRPGTAPSRDTRSTYRPRRAKAASVAPFSGVSELIARLGESSPEDNFLVHFFFSPLYP